MANKLLNETVRFIVSTAIPLISLSQAAIASPAPEKTSTTGYDCQKRAFEQLQNFDCRQSILSILPLLAHDVRKPLTKTDSARALSRDLFWIARAMFIDENEISAAAILKICHRLEPDNLTISAALLDCLSRAGYPEQAAALMTELNSSEKNLENIEVVKAVAQVKLRESDVLEADKILSRFANSKKNKSKAAKDPMFIAMQARTTMRLGYAKTGGQKLKYAASLMQNKYISPLWLAAAAGVAEKEDEREDEREKLIRKAGEILPDDPTWHIELASMRKNANTEIAKSQVGIALNAPRLYSRTYYTMSNILLNEKNSLQAEKCGARIIALRPRSAEAQFNAARLQRKQKNFDQAISFLKKGLTFNPYAANARMELATIYLDQKKDDNLALEQLKTTNELCPNFMTGWRKTGDYYRQKENWKESTLAYEQALLLVPESSDERNILAKNDIALVHAGLGSDYYSLNKRAEAVKEASLYNSLKFLVHLKNGLELLHVRPDRIEIGTLSKEKELNEHMFLADMLLETKLYEQSMNEYKEACKLNPDDQDLHSYYLNVCVESGKWQDAFNENLALSQSLMKSVPAKIGQSIKKQLGL